MLLKLIFLFAIFKKKNENINEKKLLPFEH